MKQIPIQPRVLVERINRHIQGRQLKRARGSAKEAVGEFYLVDTASQQIVDHHVDLAKLASEIGQMQPWETVGSDVKWRVVIQYRDGRQVAGRAFQSHGLASRFADKLMASKDDIDTIAVRRED